MPELCSCLPLLLRAEKISLVTRATYFANVFCRGVQRKTKSEIGQEKALGVALMNVEHVLLGWNRGWKHRVTTFQVMLFPLSMTIVFAWPFSVRGLFTPLSSPPTRRRIAANGCGWISEVHHAQNVRCSRACTSLPGVGVLCEVVLASSDPFPRRTLKKLKHQNGSAAFFPHSLGVLGFSVVAHGAWAVPQCQPESFPVSSCSNDYKSQLVIVD